jgi:hypothetical protein
MLPAGKLDQRSATTTPAADHSRFVAMSLKQDSVDGLNDTVCVPVTTTETVVEQ